MFGIMLGDGSLIGGHVGTLNSTKRYSIEAIWLLKVLVRFFRI